MIVNSRDSMSNGEKPARPVLAKKSPKLPTPIKTTVLARMNKSDFDKPATRLLTLISACKTTTLYTTFFKV